MTRIKEYITSLKLNNVLLVMLGSLIQAMGISNIHAYSDITEGGTLGFTLLVFHFTGISPAISSLIVNAACYLLGWKVLGKEFIGYSAISIAFYSACYAVFEQFAPLWPSLIASPLLCAIIGAVFIGVGAGLSVLGGGATAGDDALAMSLSKKLNCKIQYIYLTTDIVVLILSLSYIPFAKIAYSLLTVILSGQIIGWMQHLKKPEPVEKVN